MIHIEQNQEIKENNNLQVLSISGDYSDNDLIECQDVNNPGVSVGVFQAQFIKYGSLVYRFNEPEDLGKALVELDINCTHDAAILYREYESRQLKRTLGDLTPDNPVPVDENISQIAQDENMVEENIDTSSALDKATEPNNSEDDSAESLDTSNSEDDSAESLDTSKNIDNSPATTANSDEIVSDSISSSKIIDNVKEIIDVANKSQEIINVLTDAPIN